VDIDTTRPGVAASPVQNSPAPSFMTNPLVIQGGISMDIERIKSKIATDDYVYTSHADLERKADDLTLGQVGTALLNGRILEQYSDTGRGESCLILGYAEDVPIHIVCGWRGQKVAIITVYIPKPPKFIDPKTRA
jgi:hypothetical protein